MKEITVTAEEVPGAMIVRISGDANVVNAEVLDQHLTRLCTLRPRLAVLDLAGLTFISSLGMGALVSFHRAVARHGGAVRVAAATPLVQDALRRAQLHTVLSLFATVDEAIAAAMPADV